MTSSPKHYLCYRAPSAPVLDGRLDKPFWQNAAWTEDFVDIEGDAKPRPTWRTRVKMLWDAQCLYIGAHLEEPRVWATLTQHDAVIFQDNDFEVFLDPDGDNHNYYEIEINALNTTWDLRLVKPYRDGGPALNEWEIPGFRSAVHVNGTLNNPEDQDEGWSLEMALPWKALGEYANRPAPPQNGNQWRINFSRVEWDVEIAAGKYRKLPNRPEHNWVWSPQGVVDMHRPEKWGYVQFSTAPPGKDRFRSDPAAPIRDLLMQLYYAQKHFHQRRGHYASTLPELIAGGTAPLELPPNVSPPTLRLTVGGYIATCECRLPDNSRVHWHVREDSRLWPE